MPTVSFPDEQITRRVTASPSSMRHGKPPHQRSTTSLVLRICVVALLVLAVAGELGLLLIALVPQNVWVSYNFPSDGPFPHALFPVVAAAFYVLPTAIGALCRRWPVAIVLATAPAWIDLGAFAVAAAGKIGPFYLAQQDHAISTVGTLELFAVLGALGWLMRIALLALLGRGEWGQR